MEATTQLEQGGSQGLALHSTMMAVIGGSLAVESGEGGVGTAVCLRLEKTPY